VTVLSTVSFVQWNGEVIDLPDSADGGVITVSAYTKLSQIKRKVVKLLWWHSITPLGCELFFDVLFSWSLERTGIIVLCGGLWLKSNQFISRDSLTCIRRNCTLQMTCIEGVTALSRIVWDSSPFTPWSNLCNYQANTLYTDYWDIYAAYF